MRNRPLTHRSKSDTGLRRKLRFPLVAALLIGVATTGAGTTGAYFTASSALPGNSAGTATLGAPTGLTGGATSDGRYVLSWNAPTNQTWAQANNITSGIDYTVQRTYPGQSPTTIYTGQNTTYTEPARAAKVRKFSAVSLGYNHALGLAEDGSVWAWGSNGGGQLGDGTYTDRLTPVRVSLPARAVRVEAAMAYSVVLLEDHTVWTWGMNNYGQLGSGTTDYRNTPAKVTLPDGVVITSLGHSGPGSNTTFAITDSGAVYAWGRGREYQLGNETSADFLLPVLAFDRRFASISSSFQSAVGVDRDGKAWGWGAGSGYRLGNNSEAVRTAPYPVSMPSGVRVTQVVNGESDRAKGFGVALDSDGKVYTWGTIDDSTGTVRPTPEEMNITVIGPSVQVYAGSNFACALLAGDLYCWGDNGYSQLQDNTTRDRRTGVRNEWSNPETHKVKSVSLGMSAALALTDPASENATNLWAWGRNTSGEAGNGTANTNISPPAQVKGPDDCLDGTKATDGYCVAKPGTTYTLTYLFRSWLSPAATINK